jgi:ABC-type Fe3+/spermidine/putrescine transport system ATPase subunit
LEHDLFRKPVPTFRDHALQRIGVTAITIDRVARSFGEVRAVDDVSLAIRDGEFFTLLGPSGCGKTTLLRMVAGFCDLDRGRILFGDRRVDDVAPHRRNTGMVFQNYAVFPNLDVNGNVAYGLKARRLAAAEIASRVARALELVRLDGFAGRWPHQLSGGQLQRVAIARAVVIEPDVLLLDEPLSNLDAKLRVEMRGEIRALQRTLGITVIYVTHDQEEALAMSDHIAVMRAGRLEQVAAPRAIYEQPATGFVASFVGATNLLRGAVVRRDGDVADVLVGATTIRARLAGQRSFDRVALSLRPEALRLIGDGETPPPGWRMLTGTLQEVEYLGAVTRFVVRLPDGTALAAMALAPPASSGEVAIAYDPARVIMLGDGA